MLFFLCWMTEADVGVNSRALSHLFFISVCSIFPGLYIGLTESAEEGGRYKKRREKERA